MLTYDVLFVGGGLANVLAAYRLNQTRPEIKFAIIEQTETLGGNHLWSFHATDVTPDALNWLRPFIIARWQRQEVRFGEYRRVFDIEYNSISSDQLHKIAAQQFGIHIFCGQKVESIAPDHVIIEGGDRFDAKCVIDGRGWSRDANFAACAYQKFVGLELELEKPHDRQWPVIMDAEVQQYDGYRFVYTLPFAEDKILIEDTYYSDTPALDIETLTQRVKDYAALQGWSIKQVIRLEAGVLPIILDGEIETYWNTAPADVSLSGLRAGLFHPGTGYSLPDAAKFADELVKVKRFESKLLYEAIKKYSVESWDRRRFFHALNRMLFKAASPEQRVHVLARFYKLSPGLISRFYAAKLTLADKARIFAGKPPVKVSKAIHALSRTAAWKS